jgi:hypothetical protein
MNWWLNQGNVMELRGDIEETAKAALRALADVIRGTHDTLGQAVYHPTQRPTAKQQHLLSGTLEHIGDVREGFVLSQRTSPRAETSELRRLVQHVLLDWGWLEALGFSTVAGGQVELVGVQLIAYRHALVALGLLPHLPAQAITFPQPLPTYSDVPVPAMPSQTLERIEEIEQVLYQAGLVPLDELDFDAVRRTYAFFEASAWLVNHYLPPTLVH